jgi:hypothetical protein
MDGSIHFQTVTVQASGLNTISQLITDASWTCSVTAQMNAVLVFQILTIEDALLYRSIIQKLLLDQSNLPQSAPVKYHLMEMKRIQHQLKMILISKLLPTPVKSSPSGTIT